MNSDSNMLRLDGVTVRYGPTVAVDSVDLSIEQGQIVALLGPSGCGKSSLLRAVAGLEPLAAGSIWWGGVDLAQVPVHKRGIGLMFQDHALFPHRNVADNVAFGLRMARRPAVEIAERVDEMLTLVGLERFGDRTIGTLSGGQAQRVALARALAPRPGLLLLDEPLGSLDRSLRDRLVHEIRAAVTSLGITAIHVTHDHDEAISVADRLALMDAGRLVRTGTVDELLASPGDVRTAEALAIDTVFTGPVEGTGALRTPFGLVPVTAEARTRAAVLLRPSSVRVAGDASSGVAATVEGSRYRGDAWLLTCRLGDGTMVVAEHGVRLAESTLVQLQALLPQAIELEVVGSGPTTHKVVGPDPTTHRS